MLDSKYRRGLAAVGAVVALGAAGCGSSSSSSSSSGSGSGGSAASSSGGSSSSKPVKVAFLVIGTGNTFADASVQAAQAQAAKMNASVTVLNGNFSPATQLAQCQTVASSGQYQAVVLFAASGPALKPCGPIMKAGKVPLVAMDQIVTDSTSSLAPTVPGLVANVGQPPDQVSNNLVNSLVAACASLNPCNVAWFRTVTSLPQQDSSINTILNAALKQHTNMHLVVQADTGLTAQAGQQQILNFLQRTHKINALLSFGSQPASGALQGLRQSHVTPGEGPGDMRVIANGGSKDLVQDVRTGAVYATTLDLPKTEAADALKLAVEAARGQKVPAQVNPEQTYSVPTVFNKKAAQEHPAFTGEWTQ